MNPLISLNNVSKNYGVGLHATEVLHDIKLDIYEGEFVAIVGYSGSGKTTLISLIAGLITPTVGTVLYKDKIVCEPQPERALVFQNYSLLPWMTVWENISLAVDQVFSKWPKSRRHQHIRHYLEMVNLSNATQKRPSELSGGMRQRVALARALAMEPSVLLMDEPLGALDALTRGNLQDEISDIWCKNKKTVILITNDVDESILLADRVIPLSRGPKASLGPSIPVNLSRPRNRKTLNKHSDFKNLRKHIVNYLIDEGASQSKSSKRKNFTLPNILPENLNDPARYVFGKRQPKRSLDVNLKALEVEI